MVLNMQLILKMNLLKNYLLLLILQDQNQLIFNDRRYLIPHFKVLNLYKLYLFNVSIKLQVILKLRIFSLNFSLFFFIFLSYALNHHLDNITLLKIIFLKFEMHDVMKL